MTERPLDGNADAPLGSRMDIASLAVMAAALLYSGVMVLAMRR